MEVRFLLTIGMRISRGDPKFVNASEILGDPMDPGLPNLDLQSDSPCIDQAGYLTTIRSASGSGTSFTIEDAGYFMDGWSISGVQGDEIQLHGTTQRAQVVSVNYETNIVSVNQVLSWQQGQGVSLSYEGAAPDIGAFEFVNDQKRIQPTANFSVIEK